MKVMVTISLSLPLFVNKANSCVKNVCRLMRLEITDLFGEPALRLSFLGIALIQGIIMSISQLHKSHQRNKEHHAHSFVY